MAFAVRRTLLGRSHTRVLTKPTFSPFPRAYFQTASASPTDEVQGMPPPLKGIRIVDLSRILAGPTATMLLADLGMNLSCFSSQTPSAEDNTRCGRD